MTYSRDSCLPSHKFLELSARMLLCDNLRTLYLHFHNNWKDQIWHSDDLDFGTSTDKMTWPFDHVVTYHVTK